MDWICHSYQLPKTSSIFREASLFLKRKKKRVYFEKVPLAFEIQFYIWNGKKELSKENKYTLRHDFDRRNKRQVNVGKISHLKTKNQIRNSLKV